MKNIITMLTSGTVAAAISAMPIPQEFKVVVTAAITVVAAAYHLYQPVPVGGGVGH